MANHYAVQGIRQTITTATQAIIVLRAPLAGTITRIDLWSAVAVSGDAVFDLRKNGTSLWSNPNDRPKIPNGQTAGFVDGLNVTVSRGDVLTVDLVQAPSNGLVAPAFISLSIDDGAGGGGSLYTYNPDALSGTPTSYDDEFEGSALDSKWSYYNIDTSEPYCVPAQIGSRSLLRVGPRGSYSTNNKQWCGVTQPAPSGNWDFVAKVWPGYNLAAAGQYGVGMFVLNASNSLWACALWWYVYWYVRCEYWPDPNTLDLNSTSLSNAHSYSYSQYMSPVYLRIVRNGSSLSMGFSFNMLYWYWIRGYNNVSSIDRIGVGAEFDCNNRNQLNDPPYGYVDWFRRVA